MGSGVLKVALLWRQCAEKNILCVFWADCLKNELLESETELIELSCLLLSLYVAQRFQRAAVDLEIHCAHCWLQELRLGLGKMESQMHCK